jgi:hypothetical protein
MNENDACDTLWCGCNLDFWGKVPLCARALRVFGRGVHLLEWHMRTRPITEVSWSGEVYVRAKQQDCFPVLLRIVSFYGFTWCNPYGYLTETSQLETDALEDGSTLIWPMKCATKMSGGENVLLHNYLSSGKLEVFFFKQKLMYLWPSTNRYLIKARSGFLSVSTTQRTSFFPFRKQLNTQKFSIRNLIWRLGHLWRIKPENTPLRRSILTFCVMSLNNINYMVVFASMLERNDHTLVISISNHVGTLLNIITH